MTSEQKRAQVLQYLYREMAPAAAASFRAAAERDPELKALLAAEERLNQLSPVGSGPQPPTALLQESRLLLRAALRRQARPGLLERLRSWFQLVPAPLAWSAGALALLVAGFALGRQTLPQIPLSLVDLLRPEDLEVISLRVNRFEPATGKISLDLDAISQIQVEGTLGDKDVRTALASALGGDLESGTRLQVVDLLQHQAGSASIRQALIRRLLDDPNPGVRLKAIGALKGLAADVQVREAIRQALQRDLNPGVRVEAIEALKGFSDPATLQVLEQQSQKEGNTYIRGEAMRALQGTRKTAGERL